MKRVAATGLAVLALGALSACGQAAVPAKSAAPAATAAAAPLKIGVVTELTGSFSWFGTDTWEAAQLWAKTVNAHGGVAGHPVQLSVYNTQSNPVDAVEGYKQMVGQGVTAVVGLGLVSEMQAVNPLIKANGPLVYSNDGIFPPHGLLEFAGQIYSPQLEQFALEWLKARHLTKVAMLTTNDATGQLSVAGLQKAAPALGMTVTAIEYFDPSATDVTPQLTRIADSHPQAIIAWVVGKPLGVVVEGLHELGIGLPVITSDGNLTPTFLASLKSVAPKELLFAGSQDLTYGDLPAGTPGRKAILAFDAAFEKAYGHQPGLGASSEWDELNIIAEGVKLAKSLNPSAIAAAIQDHIHHYVGLQGVYDFSPQDHRGLSLKSAVMLRYANGRLQYAAAP